MNKTQESLVSVNSSHLIWNDLLSVLREGPSQGALKLKYYELSELLEQL